MLIDLFFLGIKDILRYFREFTLFLFSVAVVTILICAVTLSAVDVQHYEEDLESEFYELAPLKNNIDNAEEFYDKLGDIYSSGGYGCFSTEYISQKYDRSIICIVGRFADARVIWAVDGAFLRTHELSGYEIIDHESVAAIVQQFYFGNDITDYVFIKPAGREYQSLNGYRMTMADLVGLIESTFFTEEGKNAGADVRFEELFAENGTFYVRKHIQNTDNAEQIMIFFYVYVYVALLAVVLFLSYSFFFRHLLSKLYREYRVNIVCGATKANILARNMVFVLAMAICNLLAMEFLNAWKIDLIFYIIVVVSVVLIAIFMAIIICMLGNEDFIADLRED